MVENGGLRRCALYTEQPATTKRRSHEPFLAAQGLAGWRNQSTTWQVSIGAFVRITIPLEYRGSCFEQWLAAPETLNKASQQLPSALAAFLG